MTTDEILKTVLIISISIGILVTSTYFAALLNSLRLLIKKTTLIVEDASEVSSTISDGVKGFKEGIEKGGIIVALLNFIVKLGMLKPVKSWLKKKTGGDSVDPLMDKS